MISDDKLVTGSELMGVKRKRRQVCVFEKFEPELQEKREQEGWKVDRALKTLVRMKKPKPLDEQFEDEVWDLFASMGFEYMNKDRHLAIPYSASDHKLTKQIDVFAVDKETIIFVECKCAFIGKKGIFKDDIESIRGIREGLFCEAKKKFPNRKAKYIFATKNYEVGTTDKNRMKDCDIQYFDEYAVNYFAELTKHLGGSARFQLLGHLFDAQKITAMDNEIPAIEGKMGGQTYYSFSIEPEKLLKIAYVLHRNEANSDLMPTYQRIIKKPRLKEIQKFINSGGFFPNSLIISINTGGRKLRFDRATPQVDSAISKIGILHLPQLYRSAHIIDGQHRLYGYADSKYSDNNTVPVVAFVNLDQNKQVEMFMEINENQKAVPKNLQNTLNADLLWTSDDWNKRRKALRLSMAQRLGEIQSSPLFGRIIIGENEADEICCITIETIENALKSTNFLSRYGNGNVISEDGTFDRGDNLATRDVLLPFIMNCFECFRENLREEWENGDGNHGVLSINNSIHALIRVFNDIVNHLIHDSKIHPKSDSVENMVKEVEYYLAPLVTFFGSISDNDRKEIRTQYGSGGKTRVWRTYQRVVSESRTEFNPDGLAQWIRDNSKQFNEESFAMIRELGHIIKSSFAQKLQTKYGDKWITAGMPPKVYRQANDKMGKQNYEYSITGNGKTVSIWDCVSLTNCKEIAIYGPNWSELFENGFTRPEERKIAGGKNKKIEWLTRLAKIESSSNPTTSISENDYIFIKALYKWLSSK